jgi:hypothetical protein
MNAHEAPVPPAAAPESAAPQTPESAAPQAPVLLPPPAPLFPGHTRISTQALASAARLITAQAYGVDVSGVRVMLNDELGSLALGLNLALPADALDPDGPAAGDGWHGDADSVWARARDVRAEVRDQFTDLTGSHVSRVDIRVTGIVSRKRRLA